MTPDSSGPGSRFRDRPASERGERPRSDECESKQGLCENCANRDDCLFPRPEGGVWHCEEYQDER